VLELPTDNAGVSNDVTADDSGEVSSCSAVGTVEMSWVSAAWMLVAARVLAVWAKTAPCAASPAGLVVCCGGVNGDNVAADADEPA
jgi:hypothetical protein